MNEWKLFFDGKDALDGLGAARKTAKQAKELEKYDLKTFAGKPMLFHIEEDLGELHDVAADHPAKVKELSERAKAIMLQIEKDGITAIVNPPQLPAQKQKIPKVVEAKYDGKPVPAPEGATIQFDGKSFKGWEIQKNKRAKIENPQWKLLKEEKAMEVVSPTGFISLQYKLLTHGHLHIEWATPSIIKGKGQGRGNSGVFIEGFPEVQVLDSYKNETYPDGQAGALYKKSIPLVNACRPPGSWQCYDIFFTRSKSVDGKKIMGSITVYHNNVLIQDNVQLNTMTAPGNLRMQDHNNPVRFRNIWFKEGVKAPAKK